MVNVMPNVRPTSHAARSAIQGEAVRARVMAIIERLPQYEVVKSRVAGWVDAVMALDMSRAEWHAMRLRGFGGSEIGVLCANHLGGYTRHSSAKEIVSNKLLLATPQLPDNMRRRSIVMEPIHRAEFHAKYGCTVDERGMGILASLHGPLGWMRYYPDDLVFMPSGERVLCDYKSPDVPRDGQIYTASAAQLAMGRLVAEHNNVPISRMVLSEFSWQNWATVEHEVEHDPELDALIVEAGESSWACVMNGEVPDFVMRTRSKSFAGVDLSDLEGAAVKFEAACLLASVAADLAGEAEDQVGGSIVDRGLGAGSATIGRVSVSVDERVDVEKAAAALGGAADAARIMAYDTDKLVALVRDLGGDPGLAVQPAWDEITLRRILDSPDYREVLETCTSTFARVELGSKFKDIHNAIKEQCRSVMEDHAESLMESIQGDIARVVEGVGDDGNPSTPKRTTMRVAA